MGDDEFKGPLMVAIGRKFSGWHAVIAADANRLTLDVPQDPSQPGKRTIHTVRHKINGKAAFERLAPLLDEHQDVLLCPLSGHDHELALRLLDRVAANGGHSTLMLSNGQLADREGGLELARRASRLVMNVTELQTLVGTEGGLVDQMCRLEEEGVAELAVTAGCRGILARIGGQWYHQPAFSVPVRGDTGAGDHVVGALLAAMHEELEPRETFANAAAAAMHLAQLPRRGGWNELRAMAAATPVIRPQRQRAPGRSRQINIPPPIRQVATAAAMAFVGSIITALTLSII